MSNVTKKIFYDEKICGNVTLHLMGLTRDVETAVKIFYDEKICVKCLACVSESEFGGVTYERGQLVFDDTRPEDWQTIAEICPVAAIKIKPCSSEVH